MSGIKAPIKPGPASLRAAGSEPSRPEVKAVPDIRGAVGVLRLEYPSTQKYI